MKIKHFLLALLVSLGCLGQSMEPAYGQFNVSYLPFNNLFTNSEAPKVPTTLAIEPSAVRLDGRFLFRAAAVDGIASSTRAKEISQRLKTYARSQSSHSVDWSIDTESNQPVIYTGDRFLMTVTSADATLVGLTSVELRAEELRETLTAALDYYQYERQPDILQQRLRWAGGLFLSMVLLSWGLSRLHQWLSDAPNIEQITDGAVKREILWRQAKRIYDIKHWLFLLGELFIWVGGVYGLLGLFPHTRVWQQPLIQLLRVPLRIALTLSIGYAIVHFGDILIDRLFLSIYGKTLPNSLRTQRSSLRFSTFSQVTKSILVALVVAISGLIILGIVGVDLGPLLASAGIIGIALSLASQSLLKDIINGFMILMEDHYGIGDVVVISDMAGFVETMNLRITQLRNEEGRLITIPNGQINIVQNLSKEWSRVDLKIPVALDDDIDQALKIIKQVADDMSHDPDWESLILEEPLLLGVDNIDHTGATVRLWIKTLPLKQWDVAREYRRRLKIAFEDADLDFGVPKQVIRMMEPEQTTRIAPTSLDKRS